MVLVPVAFAALTLFHPQDDPDQLGDATTPWLTVHALQLVFTVLLVYVLWWLLDGLVSRGASVARALLPVFAVAFTAFDAVAGIATGWLARAARGETGEPRDGTLQAVETLFADNWLAGNLSILGGVTALSWVAIAVGAAYALRSAGADRLTVGLMAASALFANHPPPIGTLGLLCLGLAVHRFNRDLPSARTPA
jgi:hypothetical protein